VNSTSRNVMVCALGAVAAIGCGGDDDPCDPLAQTGCDEGVCAVVEGGPPICTDPVYLDGWVFDLADDGAIGGARVVALDVNRAPQSRVATTGADGQFRLEVPVVRNADGTPRSADLVLRADAAAYQTFPAGLRRALPIDVATAVHGDGAWVLASSLTDIGLIGLPAGSGTATLRGTVAVPEDHAGVMVVAETTSGPGRRGFDAIADRDGDYAIFNLPAGSFDVAGYARGHVYTPGRADLTATSNATVDLALGDGAGAALTGQVSIVNGGGASATSVVLFVESTFDPVLVRGAAPPGLRAPEPGLAPDVSGAFAIAGVPPGRYVVLAAFEDDQLVRDPDTCIAGTAIVHVAVDGVAPTVALDAGFKITGGLEILAPATDAVVTGTPTFRWVDDSSESLYQVQVFDSFGVEVWSTEVPGVSGGTPEVVYAGPALRAGSYYQARITSVRQSGGNRCEISQSEDLAGVFFVP